MTGVEDMMTVVKGAEATKNNIRSDGRKGEYETTDLRRVSSRSRLTCVIASAG
jgi:hypothetical protein